MEEAIVKNREVEVTPEEEGFKGAWYRAILEENPTKSGRKKLKVRYTTLVNDDESTPLTEMIDQSLIRPVPPVELYKDDVVFEEGSVVDADLKDGWWTGVVIKKSEDENKFMVYFDSPPDIIQLERNKLRAHFDWTGSNWVRPEIQELSKSEFSPGTMVEVSSVINKDEVVWFPAMIIKEIDGDDEKKKRFIVKDCNHKHYSRSCNNGDEAARPNSTVDSCRVRPTPPLPPSVKEEYQLLGRVEAFRGGFGWRQGLVRGILDEKRFMVSFQVRKEESVFIHSDLRPFQVWEDGVWQTGPKAKEAPSNVGKKKLKPIRSSSSSKVANMPITPRRPTKLIIRRSLIPETASGECGKKKKADADKASMVVTPQVTSIAKEIVSPVTPSPVISATPLKQTEAETEGLKSTEKIMEPVNDWTQNKMMEEENDNQDKREEEEEHNNSKTGETCNAEINDTSKKVCNNDDQPLSASITKLSSAREFVSPVTPLNQTEAETQETTLEPVNALENDSTPNKTPEEDEEEENSEEESRKRKREEEHNSETELSPAQTPSTHVKDVTNLPFEKKSPFWKTCESMESFKSVPQSPHFSPLSEAKEDVREWTAVGMMVTFYGLLDQVRDLKLEDASMERLTNLSESFAELEKHGFDVEMPQSRIRKMLSIEERREKKAEERKGFKVMIEEEVVEKRKFGEERADFKRMILTLKRSEEAAREKEEASEKKIAQMESTAETIEHEIQDMDLEFQNIVSAPW